METDYIIIGGGSAGCVSANRLSADPKVRTTLVEAGGEDWNPLIHIPAGYRYSALPALTSNFGWHTSLLRCGYGEMVS